MGEIFVNDGDRLATAAVLIGKDATTDQPNAHGLKIARANSANIAVRPRIPWRGYAALNVEGSGASEPTEWQWHSGGCGDDTGGIGEPV